MPHRAPQVLRACDRELELAARPLVMGILNATPDSFYDGGRRRGIDALVEHGHRLLEQGADLIDIGGQSGVTNRPPVSVDEEIERVVPVIDAVAGQLGVVVSVDTYRSTVAREAIDAGAVLVNDPSGLSEMEIARVCASSGAALVVTHTRARPKQKLANPRYADVTEDVKRFLRARLQIARSLGVEQDRLVVCPGPDLGKQPEQTVELLRRLDELGDLEAPILLSASRKDFVGALLGRPPRDRLAGTLAAIAHGVARGARILRVHDVAETRDFLAVAAALSGDVEVPRGLRLENELRWEQNGEEIEQPVLKEATA